MAHTYTELLYHIIFSTKHREPKLVNETRDRVLPYMAGIISNHNGQAIIINGVIDHVHILCRLRSKPDVADVIQAIKGGSSSWFNKELGEGALYWQEGYGAFTVSHSQKDRVYQYIQNQEAHHQRCTFAEEYEAFLIKHGIEYDEHHFLD